jgi:cytochrome P450
VSCCALRLLCAAHLLSAIDPATGKPLDDHQLKAEISTFMAAGFETTSHAITWCLTMLVRADMVQLLVVLPVAAEAADIVPHYWLPVD